jgi:hypothetical protein
MDNHFVFYDGTTLDADGTDGVADAIRVILTRSSI